MAEVIEIIEQHGELFVVEDNTAHAVGLADAIIKAHTGGEVRVTGSSCLQLHRDAALYTVFFLIKPPGGLRFKHPQTRGVY